MNHSIISAVPAQPQFIFTDSNALVSSLFVAEFHGKRHKNIIQSIGRIINPDESIVELDRLTFQPIENENFILTEYKDSKGRTYIAYDMTLEGYMELAMSFTGKAARAHKSQITKAFINALSTLGARNQAIQDKRASNLHLTDSVRGNAEARGRNAAPFDYMNAARICNEAVTGIYAAAEESMLSAEDARLLERARIYLSILLDHGYTMKQCRPMVKAHIAEHRVRYTLPVKAKRLPKPRKPKALAH